MVFPNNIRYYMSIKILKKDGYLTRIVINEVSFLITSIKKLVPLAKIKIKITSCFLYSTVTFYEETF